MLDGRPGVTVTTARRKGAEWFVGSITNNDARALALRLDFLEPGKRYLATIYHDDPAVATRTKVGMRTQQVSSTSVLRSELQASGGQAMWIRPLP